MTTPIFFVVSNSINVDELILALNSNGDEDAQFIIDHISDVSFDEDHADETCQAGNEEGQEDHVLKINVARDNLDSNSDAQDILHEELCLWIHEGDDKPADIEFSR